MSDERTRHLERLAAQGDPEAAAAAARARCRAGDHEPMREWLGRELVVDGSREFTIYAEDWTLEHPAAAPRPHVTTSIGSGWLSVHPDESPAHLGREIMTITAETGYVMCESRCRHCGAGKRLLMAPAAEQCAEQGHEVEREWLEHRTSGHRVLLSAFCRRCGAHDLGPEGPPA